MHQSEDKHLLNYTTCAEDTLYTICSKFHSTPYRIRQLNPNVNLDELQEGI